MAFAIASGVSPQRPVLRHRTAFLISALGGSKTQIGGPTGAFVVVVRNHRQHGMTACSCADDGGTSPVLLGVTAWAPW